MPSLGRGKSHWFTQETKIGKPQNVSNRFPTDSLQIPYRFPISSGSFNGFPSLQGILLLQQALEFLSLPCLATWRGRLHSCGTLVVGNCTLVHTVHINKHIYVYIYIWVYIYILYYHHYYHCFHNVGTPVTGGFKPLVIFVLSQSCTTRDLARPAT